MHAVGGAVEIVAALPSPGTHPEEHRPVRIKTFSNGHFAAVRRIGDPCFLPPGFAAVRGRARIDAPYLLRDRMRAPAAVGADQYLSHRLNHRPGIVAGLVLNHGGRKRHLHGKRRHGNQPDCMGKGITGVIGNPFHADMQHLSRFHGHTGFRDHILRNERFGWKCNPDHCRTFARTLSSFL